MKQYEAKTLEEAYELASAEFKCSITNLEIDIIQQPSSGFLGFGKKNAIISVKPVKKQRRDQRRPREQKFKKSVRIKDVSDKLSSVDKEPKKEEKKIDLKESFKNDPKLTSKEKIFDNFYSSSKDKEKPVPKIIVKKDNDKIVSEIKSKVNKLFSYTCFDIDEIKVDFYDDETIYLEFTGEDSALLIGKEGYRYKALSYILFNWIQEKYGLMLRLEVAEFLKNQEEAVYNYLGPVVETIRETGRYKTKPLDGILVHIALKRLRDEFPDKYVAVKTNPRGDKYVLVNEYRN